MQGMRDSIKAELVRQRMTQRQLAEKCGISHVHLCCFLGGSKWISEGALKNILAVLGMEVVARKAKAVTNG